MNTLYVVVDERVVMEVVRRSHVDVKATSDGHYKKPDNRIDAIRNNRTLAQAEVPDLVKDDETSIRLESRVVVERERLTLSLRLSGSPKQVFSPIRWRQRLHRCTAFFVKKNTTGRMAKDSRPNIKNVPKAMSPKNWLTSCST